MKQTVVAFCFLWILGACTTPIWEEQAQTHEVEVQDDGAQQIRTLPLSDSELVMRLHQLSLSATKEVRGVAVNLRELSFAPGETALSHEDRKRLRDLARVLADPLVSHRPIAIEGHTDSLGAPTYNLDLSKQRAQTVAHELIFNQITAERISVCGYGEQFPIEQNNHPDGSDNPSARAKNRRVEVIIGQAGTEITKRESAR
ncbi:MAG: OmpA family protein [Gammaproteobacteria bacterium]|nr:OmpA family protein [Gammaproteobacteria bacterium]